MTNGHIVNFEDSRNRIHLQNDRLEIDIQKYQELLENPDLSEAQKIEFLKAVWIVMVAFVDLGHGIHPLQRVTGKQAHEAEIINLSEILTNDRQFIKKNRRMKNAG